MQGASTQFLGGAEKFRRKASLKDRPEVYELSPLVCSLCILSALCTGRCKELRMVHFFVLAAQLYVLLLATPKVHTRS